MQRSAAEGNDQQSGSFSQCVAKWSDFVPEEIGRKAAENAMDRIGAGLTWFSTTGCLTFPVKAVKIGGA